MLALLPRAGDLQSVQKARSRPEGVPPGARAVLTPSQPAVKGDLCSQGIALCAAARLLNAPLILTRG